MTTRGSDANWTAATDVSKTTTNQFIDVDEQEDVSDETPESKNTNDAKKTSTTTKAAWATENGGEEVDDRDKNEKYIDENDEADKDYEDCYKGEEEDDNNKDGSEGVGGDEENRSQNWVCRKKSSRNVSPRKTCQSQIPNKLPGTATWKMSTA